MELLCDLHTHSCYSDGTCAPGEVVQLAKDAGLGAVALCDHSCVDGLKEFTEAGQALGVETVRGCEFSTDWQGKELHILGLFLTEDACAAIRSFLAPELEAKERSNRDLAENLTRAGYPVDYEALRSGTPGGQINRAHFAAALVEKGYVADIPTAFRTLLREDRGLYHPSKRQNAVDVVRFIGSLGALSVLAHPFLSMKDPADTGRFLTEAIPAGLGGMEVFYSKYSPETTALAREMAARFGLAESGGSDFHGGNKPDIAIGSGRGDLAVPMSVLGGLKARHQQTNALSSM